MKPEYIHIHATKMVVDPVTGQKVFACVYTDCTFKTTDRPMRAWAA